MKCIGGKIFSSGAKNLCQVVIEMRRGQYIFVGGEKSLPGCQRNASGAIYFRRGRKISARLSKKCVGGNIFSSGANNLCQVVEEMRRGQYIFVGEGKSPSGEQSERDLKSHPDVGCSGCRVPGSSLRLHHLPSTFYLQPSFSVRARLQVAPGSGMFRVPGATLHFFLPPSIFYSFVSGSRCRVPGARCHFPPIPSTFYLQPSFSVRARLQVAPGLGIKQSNAYLYLIHFQSSL
jgi:hypothetical protein